MSTLLRPIHDEPQASSQEVAAVRRELGRCRTMARSWICTIPETGRREVAALFARTAMLALARSATLPIELSAPHVRPFGRLDTVGARVAATIGELAARLDVAEGAFFISSLYTALLSASERAALGAFHTPLALSRRLADLADEAGLDWRTATVLDPACGGGALLLAVVERMRATVAAPATLLEHVGSHVVGLDIDPHAAWLGQAAVELLLADVAVMAGRPVPRIVRVSDALDEPPEPLFDLVVANPPYGRVALTDVQRSRYARVLYGHANLCSVFMDIATRWAKPDAVIAFLTPASVLGGQYFGALRETMRREAPPQAIDFVCSRRGVFEDALQETILALYRRGAPPGPIQVHYLKVVNEREADIERNGTVALPAAPRDPWLAPRQPSQSKLAASAATMTARLADWGYRVSTGPLVWNRYKDQLRETPGRDRYPLIWAESVSPDGGFQHRAEKQNHRPFFEVRAGNEWLLVRESLVLVQRTTAKEQARRLIAAQLPASLIDSNGAVVVENHLNMVRAEPVVRVSMETLTAVLNSAVVDQLFRCISGSVAVSAFELEALPLPDPDETEDLEAMVAAGASAREIDRALAGLYGISWPL